MTFSILDFAPTDFAWRNLGVGAPAHFASQPRSSGGGFWIGATLALGIFAAEVQQARKSRQSTFKETLFSGNEIQRALRLLEQNGFRIVREKGSIRYYRKIGVERLIRVDYHGSKEVPT